MAKPMSAAMRRYLIRFFPAMFAYVGVLVGSLWMLRNKDPQGLLLWLLAIAPAVPVIAVIAIMGLYLIEETDEFQRAMLAQAMLWGIGITLAVCTAWGFLENADLVPHQPFFLVFPLFCASMGLAQPIVRWRYR